VRVWLTGATGFVGTPVVERLLARGHEVHALVHPEDGRELDVRANVVLGDLLRPESYIASIDEGRPEAFIHLGWYANPKDYLSSRVNLDLLSASAFLGARLTDIGCKRLIGVGTCFEYDVDRGYLREDGPLGPQHLYSACKRAVGEIWRQLTRGTTTSYAWARLFFMYGPREQPGRLVRSVIESLLTGARAKTSAGLQIRDFAHVGDVASGIVHVMESGLAGPVNVATGVPVRVRDVVAAIARQLGKEDAIDWGAFPPRANDPPFVCADISKLRASGWAPGFDLESGLSDTIAWVKGEMSR
jgi:nucleoside-diphosphate-sugar epimerase